MPARRAYLRRALHWIANRGWRSFTALVLQRIGYRLRREPVPGQARPETGLHPFDVAYQVDTGGLLYGEALFDGPSHTEAARKSQPRSQYWVTGYYGVAPSAFAAALIRLDLDWSRFTFIDIGCGKGRALLLASRHPFREIVGVELADELANVAKNNLRSFSASWRHADVPMRVLLEDATAVPLPAGPLLLFLYHPFAGPVMKRFLAHLLASFAAEPREMILLYANPELAPEILCTPGFVQLWQRNFFFSAEDIAADRFGSTYEQIAAFQLSPAA